MAEAELCRDERLGRPVALKRLRWELAASPEARARFDREIQVQARLDHPAVVPVFDRGRGGDGRAFFTMRRIGGRTLEAALRDLARIPAPEGRRRERTRLPRAFLRACLALDYAHGQGVIHRDLKPSNLMLGAFGELYVLDWGVARLVSEPADPTHLRTGEGEAPEPGLTHARHLLGTPAYMSPEQRATPARVDARSDVYALGAGLYEILCGERLLADPDGPRPTGARLHPSRVDPDALVELDGVVERACDPDPARRHPTARDLHDAVEAALDGDRDLTRRRELADGHREQAEHHARRGEVGPALQQAGRALALDPDNADTVRLLSEQLLRPTGVEPTDLLEERRSLDRRDGSRALRGNAAATVAVLFLVAVVLPFTEVLRRGLALAALLPPLLGGLLLAQGRTRSEPTPAELARSAAVGLCFAAPVVASAAAFGPWVLPPMISVVVCVVTVCVVGIRWRRLMVVGMSLAALIGVQVACAGWGDALGLQVGPTGIALAPVTVRFGAWITPVTVSLLVVGLVTVATEMVRRNIDGLLTSRRDLHRLEWRPRQMSALSGQDAADRTAAPG
jgi:serine/threonine-protein kinase